MIIVQDYFVRFRPHATSGEIRSLWFDVAYRRLWYYVFRYSFNLPCDTESCNFCIILFYFNRLLD